MDLLTSMFRRWYVSMPILVLTAVLIWFLEQSDRGEYRLDASLRLETPAFDHTRGLKSVVDLDGLIDVAHSRDLRDLIQRDDGSRRFVAERVSEHRIDVQFAGVLERAAVAADHVLLAMAIAAEDQIAAADLPEQDRLEVRTFVRVNDAVAVARGAPTVQGSLVLQPSGSLNAGVERPNPRLLQILIESEQGRLAVLDLAGGEVDFRVIPLRREGGGIIDLTVTAPTTQQARSGMDALMTTLQQTLDDRQSLIGIPSYERAWLDVFAPPGEPSDASGFIAVRSLFAALFGLALAAGASILEDGRHGVKALVFDDDVGWRSDVAMEDTSSIAVGHDHSRAIDPWHTVHGLVHSPSNHRGHRGSL